MKIVSYVFNNYARQRQRNAAKRQEARELRDFDKQPENRAAREKREAQFAADLIADADEIDE